MKENEKRLIVVLGMHRSGTSAITRGLRVLGIELGDRLLSPADGDNDKGYWEDIDFNALNIEMLHALDKDWYYTSQIVQADVEILKKKGYLLRAGKLLNDKLEGKTLFGLKDPRIAKLLPFWQAVFDHSGLSVSYVLAVRHPLSVVKSLENRGWKSRERSYLLWLNHLITSLSLTDSSNRVMVDYDDLMQDSGNELARLANGLHLSIDKKELDEYQTSFLDQNLRHSTFQPNDSTLDPCCPALVSEVYIKLKDLLSADASSDDQKFRKQVKQWVTEYDRLSPILTHIDKTVMEAMQSDHYLSLKEVELGDLTKSKIELAETVSLLQSEKAESDNLRIKLKESLLDRDEQISENRRQLIEYDGLAHKLNTDLAENRAQLSDQEEVINKLNEELAEFKKNTSKLEAEIADTHQQFSEQAELVKKLEGVITRYTNSISNQEAELAENLQKFIEYEKTIKKLNTQMTKYKENIRLQDVELEENQQRFTDHDQLVDTLKEDIARLGQTVDSQTGILKHREIEASDLREVLSILEQENERTLHENGVLRTQLLEMGSSTSWRITSPLRVIKNTCVRWFPDLFAGEQKLKGFDADWYLDQNPDVRLGGHDPLQHYLKHGEAEGRAPRPAQFFARNKNRVKILALLSSQVVSETGGIFPAAKKAIKVLRRDGFRDLKSRILDSHSSRLTYTVDQLNYADWIKKHDTLSDESRSFLKDKIARFSYQPLISVVMPVYNANPVWLAEAINSVCNQIYPNWELCIADDASTDESIRPILEEYAANNPRIKVVFRAQNGHISATSNSALELVEGDWVALLDHDDLISEHALFWIADCVNENPDAQLIYSDEDKINEAGVRSAPYFKCDWNIDLFYSQNMFSHLGVYKTDLLRSIDGFRLGLEGSQDYDLALRCIEKIDENNIKHIPRVLYHWRIHEESTASSSDAKPYAMIAGERAINEHFERTGVNAVAELLGHGYRVKYALPKELPMVSLIIPTRDNLFLLKQCIDSIFEKTTYPNYEIVIVDNGSVESDALEYLKNIKKNPAVQVIRDDNPFNFSALNNLAVAQTSGEIVGLINNDIEVISEDWLEEMVSLAMRDSVGAVGAKLWFPNDTIQHAGIILGCGKERIAGHAHIQFPKSDYGYFGRAVLMQSFSAVTAACLIIRKDIYNEIGGMNEHELGVGFNDVDFCLRVREAGYKNIWTPYAELYHHESASRGHEDDKKKRARFRREVDYMKDRWGDLLLADPAYSPNLTLDYGDFTYAWRPRLEQLG